MSETKANYKSTNYMNKNKRNNQSEKKGAVSQDKKINRSDKRNHEVAVRNDKDDLTFGNKYMALDDSETETSEKENDNETHITNTPVSLDPVKMVHTAMNTETTILRGQRKIVVRDNLVDSTPPVTISADDNVDDGWVEAKAKKHKVKKTIDIPETDNYTIVDTLDYGDTNKLKSTWNVWVHRTESNDWSNESYKIIYKLDTLSTFWKFFNNVVKLDYIKYQFYIMRSNSCPTWEHETNRNGGNCSIRLSKDKMIDLLEQLAVLILNETFNDLPQEINGLSFGVKVNWGLIKIWNSNNKHDITAFVPSYMTKKYMASCRYKSVEPEY
jgi:hypothetical protein